MIGPREKFSKKRSSKPAIIAGCVVVALIVAYFVVQPARVNLSQVYLSAGDEHLGKFEYLEAQVDYKKSQWLCPNQKAENRIKITDEMQNDVSLGEAFFRDKNSITTLDVLNKARKVPESENTGLADVKQMIQDNQPQFAEITAQTLTEMDDSNSKTWMYLGIARFQSARIVQMTAASRENKLNSAKEAFSKANELDQSDPLAKKYLDEVGKLL